MKQGAAYRGFHSAEVVRIALCQTIMILQHSGVQFTTADKERMQLLILSVAIHIASVHIQAGDRLRYAADFLAKITTELYTEHYESNNSTRNDRTVGDKRRKTRHDHERAWSCIQQDYLGPEPIFTDKQFEQVHRLTKVHVQTLIDACCRHEPDWFVPGKDAIGEAGIRAEVKVLCTLKTIAFGCSPVAFRDYYQLCQMTGTEGLKAFFRAILKSDLPSIYLRKTTEADVQRITEMHEKQHGVPGLLLSLDCLHVFWKNCPVALQGHYKNGKNKWSSVILEGGVDYNLWFWSSTCGHAGTNNDINVWDTSPLLTFFLSPECPDFPYRINNKAFDKLCCLMDGIYLEIARFVKTIKQPIGKAEQLFSEWQESCRKDSERAFRVLVRKFQFLARPIEYWDMEDIKRQIYGCIIMHNMMVETRMDRKEKDNANMYVIKDDGAHVTKTVVNVDDNNDNIDDDSAIREARLRDFVRLSIGLTLPEDEWRAQIELQKRRWSALYVRREPGMNKSCPEFMTHNPPSSSDFSLPWLPF